MSTNGNYLTEEDPNKKKPEGTTPSATPTTATGGTTTPPLPFEGFVGTGSGSQAYQAGVGVINSNHDTAVEAATTNRDLGYEYAEGVKNSIYGMAAAQRAEADKNTEIARQRGIIDSQSSYQKAIGAYGSNAETLAGRGLSGSGYGEYLTADAYATHRGQVQNINADALRANREAAYTEKQAQMAADSEYLKNLYGINTEFNNAMSKAKSKLSKGLYQSALGLNEAQNTAYGKLFDSASKGVSIDAIMQDGTWGDLTTEQQNAITAEAERVAKVKRDERMSEYVDLAAKGTSLEDIKTMMAINGDTYVEELTPEEYEKLSDEEKAEYDEARNFMKLIESAIEKYTNQNATNETLTNIDNAIADGATLEEIESMPGYDELDDNVKEQIGEQVTARDEQKEVTIDSVVANLFVPGNEVYSLDDLDTVMRAEGVPSEMREEVISRWQSENVSRALSGIKDGRFFDNTSAADLVENIKNGVYGNRGDDVAAEYSKVLQASIQEADCDIVDFALASDSFDQIKEYLPTNITNRWESEKGNRLKIDPKFAMTNDSKIGSTPVKKGEKITDEATVAALNRYKTDSKTQLITIGNNKYYRDGDSWSLVVEDMSKPIALTAYHLFNDVSGTGTVATQGTGYAIEGKKIGFATIDKASKTALKNKYPAPTEMMYVKVGTRYYVYMGNDWKYAYITE